MLDSFVTEAAPTFRCIYCGEHKLVSDRSLEHLWPQGLGGRYAPDFFVTRDVCRRCNNVAGLFVDAEFQRSFFMGVESIGSALSFLDGSRATPLPLVYMDHAERFQAKLALGFGYALFGDAFSQIPYESVLRSVLRERDPARRAEFPFVGSSLFAPPDPDPVLDRLSYPGAFTFLFNGSRQGVFLTIYSPGGRRIDTLIAPEPVTLPSKLMEQYFGSFAVLIVPARTASFGPFPIGHYALHRFGTQSIPALAHLDALRVPLQELEKRIAHLEIPQPR